MSQSFACIVKELDVYIATNFTNVLVESSLVSIVSNSFEAKCARLLEFTAAVSIQMSLCSVVTNINVFHNFNLTENWAQPPPQQSFVLTVYCHAPSYRSSFSRIPGDIKFAN